MLKNFFKKNKFIQDMVIAYKTDKGLIRSGNEDSLVVIGPDRNPDAFDLKKRGMLFAVADGMGGHAAGEVASKMVCDGIRDYYLGRITSDKDRLDYLENLFLTINKAVLEKAMSAVELTGMGTTLSVLILRPSSGWIVHVGDSRIYRLRNDSFKLLTRDHTEVQSLIDRGIITSEEAVDHPMRNILNQAIGVDKKIKLFKRLCSIKKNDVFLLCSDGLYDMVVETKIHNIILKNMSSPQQACDDLVQAALDAGGRDNVSVIIVSL
ncbi:PPM family protein phosphatase [Candidatus Magnetomoraceae bacterium gMMP-15]